MILPTSHTSAQFFRYSSSSASLPLSHYTKTSGRVTPAGPVHRHGHLSLRASTCTGSKIATQHGCRQQGVRGGGHSEDEHGLWLCGYQKLAAATMAWAGDTFAPKLRVRDGVPIQRFLQDAFLDMWEAVVGAVGDLDSDLGFEVRCLDSY